MNACTKCRSGNPDDAIECRCCGADLVTPSGAVETPATSGDGAGTPGPSETASETTTPETTTPAVTPTYE